MDWKEFAAFASVFFIFYLCSYRKVTLVGVVLRRHLKIRSVFILLIFHFQFSQTVPLRFMFLWLWFLLFQRTVFLILEKLILLQSRRASDISGFCRWSLFRVLFLPCWTGFRCIHLQSFMKQLEISGFIRWKLAIILFLQHFMTDFSGVFKWAGPLRRRGSGRHDKAAATRGWSEGFAQRARRCEVSSDTFPSLQKIF